MDRVRLIGPRERILYLKSIALFAKLGSVDLLAIAEHARERLFRRGERLLRPEEPVRVGPLRGDGAVELRWRNEVVQEVRPPDSVGMLGLLARVDGGVEAIATRDTWTLEISAEHLYEAFEGNFRLLLAALRQVVLAVVELRGALPGDEGAPRDAPLGVYPELPLSLVDQLLSYRRLALFREANLDAVAELCHLQVEQRFAAGDCIWRAGDPGESIIQLAYGAVLCDPEDGREPLRLAADYSIGLSSLAGAPRSYGVVADTDVVALVTKSEDFIGVLEDQFDLAMTVAASLSRLLVSVRGKTVATKLSFADMPASRFYAPRRALTEPPETS